MAGDVQTQYWHTVGKAPTTHVWWYFRLLLHPLHPTLCTYIAATRQTAEVIHSCASADDEWNV